jgi:hypothetical protein
MFDCLMVQTTSPPFSDDFYLAFTDNSSQDPQMQARRWLLAELGREMPALEVKDALA